MRFVTLRSLLRVVVAAAILGFAAPATVQSASPAFVYNFPASSSNLSGGTVLDLSSAGHHGTPSGFVDAGLSVDIPPGMPPSDRSIDCGTVADQRRINTNALQLLSNTAILASGGFVMDAWFKTNRVDIPIQTVIDYAGTEKIFVQNNTVVALLSATPLFTAPIVAGTWYHAQFYFTNPVGDATSVTGDALFVVNGVTVGSGPGTKSNFGDSLNRPTGICMHPTMVPGNGIFDGLVYAPRVSLGPPSNRSCKEILDSGLSAGDGVYTIDPDGAGLVGPMNAYCDMTTDGGGWTLVMNYLHQSGTFPSEQVRTTDLPLLGSSTLGTDESGTAYWGHASNSLFNALGASEVRFQGQTSGHSRVLHFKTDLAGCIAYFGSGVGNCSGIQSSFTPLAGHTTNLPAAAYTFHADVGDLALVTEPFYADYAYHWSCNYMGFRWELDDYEDPAYPSTLHRVWVRGTPAANTPPVAVDDTFAALVDQSRTAAAPGVLANDTDADLDLLTVGNADTTSAQGGSVSVSADGSFTYTPPLGYVGTDTFTYAASDGSALSNMATVTIFVQQPTSCAVIAAVDPAAPDGDYLLWTPFGPISFYCHDMAGTPREYISLVQTAPFENFGRYQAGGGVPGTDVVTDYAKLRVDPATLRVQTGDQAFSTSSGSLTHGTTLVTSMPYGVAMDCMCSGLAEGTARVDLRGTNFVVNDTWIPWSGLGDAMFSDANQVVTITGGGCCGWNCPEGCFDPYNFSGPPLQLALYTAITVDTFSDDMTVNGNCTLREAIQAANTDTAVDGCAAGSGPDTITLAAGSYTLTLVGAAEDANATGDLDVTDHLTLIGAGADLTTITASGLGDRVLQADPTSLGIAVVLQGLTVTGGSFTVTGGGLGGGGGGISSGAASLGLTGCAVRSNQVIGSGANVIAVGGGIHVGAGTLAVDSSEISGNSVSDGGVAGRALLGGGVAVGPSVFGTITNSTISVNNVLGNDVSSSGYGGGLYVDGLMANIDLDSVTVVFNSVSVPGTGEGGGVYNANLAATNFTASSIIAGNSAPSGPDYVGDAGSFGYNLVQFPIGTLDLISSDMTGCDPLLGALADNGGPTQTHAPQWGSPVVDLGALGGPVTDQRGAPRPAGLAFDTGSVEEQNVLGCGAGGRALYPLPGWWYLIGLPCDPMGATVSAVFGDDLPIANYGTTWAVVRRDAASDAYVQLDPVLDPLSVTEGYWFKTLEAPTGGVITVDGGPLQGALLAPLVGDPAGRANLVGNPMETAYPWPNALVEYGGVFHTLDEAELAGQMSKTMWRWNGSSYQSYAPGIPGQEGELFRFDGFWVKAYGAPPLNLVLGGGFFGAPPATRSELSPAEWMVRLIAEGAELYDPGNLVGHLEGSCCQQDGRDLEEMAPFTSPYLTVVFPHPEWGKGTVDYTTDFRPPRQAEPACSTEWGFEVRTSEVGVPVTLRWHEEGGVGVLPAGWLRDEVSGETVATAPGGSYTFTTTDTVRRFTFGVDMAHTALIFLDGFASGDESAWSSVMP